MQADRASSRNIVTQSLERVLSRDMTRCCGTVGSRDKGQLGGGGNGIAGKEREPTGVSEQRSVSIGGGQRMEIQRLHPRGALTFDVLEFGRILIFFSFYLAYRQFSCQSIRLRARPCSQPSSIIPRGAASTNAR